MGDNILENVDFGPIPPKILVVVGKDEACNGKVRDAALEEGYEVRDITCLGEMPSREVCDPELIVCTSSVGTHELLACAPIESWRTKYLYMVKPQDWEYVEPANLLSVFSEEATVSEIRFRLKEAAERRQFRQQLRLTESTTWSGSEELGKFISSADWVTGLDNRMQFLRELKGAISRSKRYDRPFCCVLARFDNYDTVDGFVELEDMEIILEQLAGIFETSIRDADVLARIQKDLFGLILTETDQKYAQTVVGRIETILANYPFQSEFPETIKLSFGIAPFVPDSSTPENLIAYAESRMAE